MSFQTGIDLMQLHDRYMSTYCIMMRPCVYQGVSGKRWQVSEYEIDVSAFPCAGSFSNLGHVVFCLHCLNKSSAGITIHIDVEVTKDDSWLACDCSGHQIVQFFHQDPECRFGLLVYANDVDVSGHAGQCALNHF